MIQAIFKFIGASAAAVWKYRSTLLTLILLMIASETIAVCFHVPFRWIYGGVITLILLIVIPFIAIALAKQWSDILRRRS